MARMSTRRKKMLMQKRKKQAIIGGLILACILLIYLIIQLVLWNYVRKNTTDTIPEGIMIGETDVSGMSKKEATQSVDLMLSAYQNATLTLKLDDARTTTVTAAELGITIDNEKGLVQKAYDYNRKGSLFKRWRQIRARKKKAQIIDVTYGVNLDTTTNVVHAKFADVLTEPVNSTLTTVNDVVTITESKPGEVIDFKAAVKAIDKFLCDNWAGSEGTIDIPVGEHDPEVTEDALKGMPDLLGTYTTFYDADGSGHATNVEVGANHVGGRILKAGEKISVEEALMPSLPEYGYVEANSYESGTVVQTYGGGICQVSTTLYNAVLYAELEVLERSPHSMLVNYVPPSRDAAIAEGVLDFVFRNNLDNPIYIESVLADGYLTFNIYGTETRPAGRTIEFESETLQTEDLEGDTYVSTNQPIGYFMEFAPYQGQDAQLWKVVYQDGVEESREVINTSHYQATKRTYSVGIQSDNPTAANTVINAIGSQNADTIQAAISTALQQESQGTE